MSAPRKHKLSSNEVASAYQCTRQNANILLHKYGRDVEDPDRLFARLLETRSNSVRSKLADPAFREAARKSLMGAAFRQAVKP